MRRSVAKKKLWHSYYKLEVNRLSYNSPPKIEISVKASFDVQKCLETIFNFIKHLIHHKEHGEMLAAAAEAERQRAISQQIKNVKAITELLDRIPNPALRARAEQGLIARIVPLFDESGDYGPLNAIEIDSRPPT